MAMVAMEITTKHFSHSDTIKNNAMKHKTFNDNIQEIRKKLQSLQSPNTFFEEKTSSPHILQQYLPTTESSYPYLANLINNIAEKNQKLTQSMKILTTQAQDLKHQASFLQQSFKNNEVKFRSTAIDLAPTIQRLEQKLLQLQSPAVIKADNNKTKNNNVNQKERKHKKKKTTYPRMDSAKKKLLRLSQLQQHGHLPLDLNQLRSERYKDRNRPLPTIREHLTNRTRQTFLYKFPRGQQQQ